MEEDDTFGRWGRRRGWGTMEILIAAAIVWYTGLFLSWILKSTGLRRGQRYRLPPGPKGWPLLGAIPYLGELPHRSFQDLSKKYGPIMFMHLGSQPLLVVSNAEMAKEVLQTHDQILATRPDMIILNYLSWDRQGLIWASDLQHWRQFRKIVTSQLLTNAKLTVFTGVMKDEILRTIHTILEESQSSDKPGDKDGVDVNVSARISGATMNIITQMMWKQKHRNIKGGKGNDRDKMFVELMDEVMHLCGSDNVADFLPSCLRSFTMKISGLDKKMKNIRKDLDTFYDSIIQAAVDSKETTGAAADEDDLLQGLLKIMDGSEDSPGLSKGNIKSILHDVMFAGSDTSSTLLHWILAELMRNPDIMKKLQAELATVVGEDRLVSESDIPNLKYLDALVKEGLRRHTIAPLNLPHCSMADCKISGYDVPANTMVFVNQFAIHHDSTIWEHPWEFNPDRFLQSEVDFNGRHFGFIPFSSGRRMCPGYHVAASILHLALAQFVHTIEWSLPEGQTPENLDMSERSGITLGRADPLILNAKPRLAHDVIYCTVRA